MQDVFYSLSIIKLVYVKATKKRAVASDSIHNSYYFLNEHNVNYLNIVSA